MYTHMCIHTYTYAHTRTYTHVYNKYVIVLVIIIIYSFIFNYFICTYAMIYLFIKSIYLSIICFRNGSHIDVVYPLPCQILLPYCHTSHHHSHLCWLIHSTHSSSISNPTTWNISPTVEVSDKLNYHQSSIKYCLSLTMYVHVDNNNRILHVHVDNNNRILHVHVMS